jgi:hypothetical protein
MKITDRFFEKEFFIDVDDPYTLSLKIMDRLRGFYNVSEKLNEYKTDGPEQLSNVMFVITKEIDDYATIKMEFDMTGSGKRMNIKIMGEIVLVLDNYGLFSESFTEFYMEKLYKDTREKCEKTIYEIKKRFDRMIEIA